MSDINYLGNTPLGKIQEWSDVKAATITPISFPGKDAGNTEGIDTLGIIAYYNLSGRFTGQFRNIQSYIYALKAIADGLQISSQKLYSPFVNGVDNNNNPRVGSIGTITSTVTPNRCTDTYATFVTNGVQTGDKVKNLVTGQTANVTSVIFNTQLALDADIFQVLGHSYAVTANINVKVLSFEVRWELPGLSYCDYTLSVMQVK